MLAFFRSSNEEDNTNNLMILGNDYNRCSQNAYNYFRNNHLSGYPVCYAKSLNKVKVLA